MICSKRFDPKNVNHLDTIYAKFEPVKLDIKPEAKHQIGHIGEYQASWIIESGEYEGQWAMLSHDPEQYHWVPLCDLVQVEGLKNKIKVVILKGWNK